MAVPFNIPEENEVEVLLLQLQTLISRLQVAVRRNQQQSSNVPNSRVRSAPRSRSTGASNSASTSGADAPPLDLLTQLSQLDSASPLTAISVRPPRQRNASLSNSDETKISITAIVKHDFYGHDCNKVESLEVSSSESSLQGNEGIFSKLTPASVSSCSLMTAMICFMGWHIFRAR